ncbi:MAG: gluconolactonase, partial [Limnochordia bacterium]
MRLRAGMLAIICLVLILNSIPAAAFMYQSYYVDYYGTAVPAPHAYVPRRLVYGSDLGVGDLKSPQDVVVVDNAIYIVDTGNHRIIHTDLSFNVIRVIDSFERDGKLDKFRNPYSVFVDREGRL